ncbi:MAG: hypothetical protein LBS99_07085 [Clostridiales bacterium]|jgi:hypothetical protein|nr:hypothetical protein [Clostridiales bacterium]
MKLLANTLLGAILAANETFTDFGNLIQSLYEEWRIPIIAVVSGAALLLGVWLGLKFLLAGGDEQKIKKAKESIKYFVIGIAVIFVVTAGMPVMIGAFQTWAGGAKIVLFI